MELKRDSVITSCFAGKLQKDIVKASLHLHVNKFVVSDTIACYRDTGSIVRRQESEGKKFVTTPEMV